MDIKEFRNNNNREGKKRPEYPDEKDGTVNYKIYAVIGIIAVVLAAAIAMFININRFDIKKYIKPIYTGANGYASVRFDIDEAVMVDALRFLERFIHLFPGGVG